MSRPSVVALVWGMLLLALGVVLWAVFTPAGALSYVLPAGAVAGAAVIAAISRRHRAPPGPGEEVLALSPATPTLAIGLALALLGLAVGPWLYLIGAGVALLGLFGLAREGR